jgi:phage-related tail fiber protein
MNISGPIRKLIQDNATAYALLSDRIYPIISLQDSAFPNVAVRRKGGRESANHTQGSDVDLVICHIIINAATASSAYMVDNAIRTAIDRYRGTVTFKDESTVIDGIKYLESDDDYNQDSNAFQITSVYQIRVKRTPTP